MGIALGDFSVIAYTASVMRVMRPALIFSHSHSPVAIITVTTGVMIDYHMTVVPSKPAVKYVSTNVDPRTPI